jgi:asparagine synthase (glutamine-hydrolysing)
MRERLIHRGPACAGAWLDAASGMALGHRRLSIVDLSPAGQQPMTSVSGRYVLAYNGEIYNHMDMRRSIEQAAGARAWRGHSDTESLLAAIEQWGVTRALQTCVGMFAVALWDRQTRSLTLARDRMGEKPLYYGWQGKTLLFASELKALTAHPAFQREINDDALPLYLRHGYIPAPWSVWRGVYKLQPGALVVFTEDDCAQALPQPQSYWSLADVIAQGQSQPFEGSDQEAIDALEARLSQAIAGQKLADVPVGAFLSGGIDSSTVVALMQRQSSQAIRTFTIGFHEKGYNEATHAQAVSKHLGTAHTELYVSDSDSRDVIPGLVDMYDEPFGDSSAIPTHLVSRLARTQVTVSLSGDGGDELFGGYGRYFNQRAERIWQMGRDMPAGLRRPAMAALRSPFPGAISALLAPVRTLTGRQVGASLTEQCGLAARLLGCDTHAAYYRSITSQWQPSPHIRPTLDLPYGYEANHLAMLREPVEQMMAQDSVTYLPDDILVKVDRAAMAVSLETRVPLLDHRVVELAWRLPYRMKVRDGQGKWLLRQVLDRHVPRELMARPKMGFGVPIGSWMRGPLREWAEDLISETTLKAQGHLNAQQVRQAWQRNLTGQSNHRDSLWVVLMWQAWQQRAQQALAA